jgi:hypothetical protein
MIIASAPTQSHEPPKTKQATPLEAALNDLPWHDQRRVGKGALAEMFDGKERFMLHAECH